MHYLSWSAPLLAVIACIGSGRVGSIGAGIAGLALAAFAALTTAPVSFGGADAVSAAAHGTWLAGLLGAVILGGLFFREIVVAGPVRDFSDAPHSDVSRRSICFAACFLIGPFTEASTGYGVGQVATISLLRGLGLAPLHVAVLGLFSQILVPWGAMANGTMVGAILAKLPPQLLGLDSAYLTACLLAAWLPIFWMLASAAGLSAGRWDWAAELAWTLALAGLLVASNTLFPPDVAALAALGLLIALRFLCAGRTARAHRIEALRAAAPYGILVLGLVACRTSSAIAGTLARLAAVEPFADAPVWYPFLHPGSWLVIVGCLTAVAARRPAAILHSAQRAWSQGSRSVLTIALFLIMSQLMAGAGITDALAHALQDSLGPAAALATPLLAGALGFLCGSGNASNSLLMTAQVALAGHAGISVHWLAAVQNTAAAAMTMFSPVRLTMGCALADAPGIERQVYARAWPLGVSTILILTGVAAILAF